jgi:hypothetical protein
MIFAILDFSTAWIDTAIDIATTNQDQLRQTMNRTPSSSARGAHKQQKKGEERSSGAGELRREKTSMGGEKTWRLFT